MINRCLLRIGWAIALILIFSFSAFSLDENEDEQDLQEERISTIDSEQEILQESEVESIAEEDIGWVWGDVVFMDTEGRQFGVKYFDYESEADVEIALFVDEDTVFENVQGLSGIKVQDSLSVDYIIRDDDKNIARLISVEKQVQELKGTVSIP